MSESPKNVSAASKLMSELTGQTRPAHTLPRQAPTLSREKLTREMTGFYNNCASLIQSCAQIGGVLRHPDISSSKDFEKIKDTAGVLNTDLRAFSERLKDIYAKQIKISSIEDDGSFHMATLTLGEEYAQWTTEFTNVVVPNFEALVSMVSGYIDQGSNTQSVKPE